MLISFPACSQDVNSELLKVEDVDSELLKAAENGQTDRVKSLLAAGADVNAADNEGVTALIWATYKGHSQTVKALLHAGADADAKGMDGLTALMNVKSGNGKIVQILADGGADLEP